MKRKATPLRKSMSSTVGMVGAAAFTRAADTAKDADEARTQRMARRRKRAALVVGSDIGWRPGAFSSTCMRLARQHLSAVPAFLKIALALFTLLFLLPLGLSALRYRMEGLGEGWWTADRSSAGLLPPASANGDAVVRIFSAQTVRWRGIFATHCWIVIKPEGAGAYERFDYTAWGDPIRVNGFVADGRWFGRAPRTVFAADGAAASALIPRMQAAIAAYSFRAQGDYRAWPGPNSNTFVAAVMDAVPEMRASLPSTAIGKDFPYDGRWLRATPSRTGVRLSLGGYAGVTFGWVEGIEVNILGAVAGLDVREPGIKLPGWGRLGLFEGGWNSQQ